MTQLPGKQRTDQQGKEAEGGLEWEEQEEEKKVCDRICFTGRLSCIKSTELNKEIYHLTTKRKLTPIIMSKIDNATNRENVICLC